MTYKVTLQDKSIASIESDDVLYEDGAVIFINDDGQIVALFTPGSALHVISEEPTGVHIDARGSNDPDLVEEAVHRAMKKYARVFAPATLSTY